jgi:tetratricopeptide (TPR) repeat protein
MNFGSPRSRVSTPIIALIATCGGCLLIAIISVVLVAVAAVNSPPFLSMRATTLQNERRYGEAEALLLAAARKSPNDWHILNNLAWLYYLDGKYAQGEPFARHSVEIDRNPYNVDTLAHIDLGLNRYEAAEREFKSALQTRPASAESHDGLGQVYERLGQRDKALKEYNAAIGADPNIEGTQARIDRLQASVRAAKASANTAKAPAHAANKKGGE